MVWGALSLRQLHIIEMPSDIVHVATWNNIAAMGHSDGLVRIIDLESGQQAAVLQGSNELIHRLAVNEYLVAALDISGNVRVWDADQWKLIQTIKNRGPRTVGLRARQRCLNMP